VAIAGKRAEYTVGMISRALPWCILFALAVMFLAQGWDQLAVWGNYGGLTGVIVGAMFTLVAGLKLISMRGDFVNAFHGRQPKELADQPKSSPAPIPFTQPERSLATKKLWFYATIARIGFAYLLAAGFVVLFLCIGIGGILNRNPGTGVIFVAIALVIAFIAFMRLVILRYHIVLGKRRELRRRNCCPNCEYDLRASAIRCPECGYAIRSENVEV